LEFAEALEGSCEELGYRVKPLLTRELLVTVEEAHHDDADNFVEGDKVGNLAIGVAVVAKIVFREWVGDGEGGSV
jgi:hypothetical protein